VFSAVYAERLLDGCARWLCSVAVLDGCGVFCCRYYRNDSSPPYRLKFIEESPLSSIETLLPHLETLWVSNISSDGVDRRTELSNTLTFVSKMIELRGWLNRK
jgi:hypothetical protein